MLTQWFVMEDDLQIKRWRSWAGLVDVQFIMIPGATGGVLNQKLIDGDTSPAAD